MAYVTFKNRTSTNYKFTVTDLNDPMIAELKEMLEKENAQIKASRKRYPDLPWVQEVNTKGIRIRPRGSRTYNIPKVMFDYRGRMYTKKTEGYDTPMENATHFDVYIRENIRY